MPEITACGLCGGTQFRVLLDMGMQPLAERDSDPYPLVLLECAACTLAQLSYAADQREVFPPEHPYATGNTKALREHFRALAADLPAGTGPVIDIGANDGTFLSHVTGRPRVAVEPTEQVAKALGKGIEHAYQQFFSRDLACRIRAECGPADVVVASNVLAHVPDAHDFAEGVRVLLKPDGWFITENHDVAAVLGGQWDAVYHEHLRYFSAATVSLLLARHGLAVRSVTPVRTHGGSLRARAQPQAGSLAEKARLARTALHAMVARAASEGPVYGIGAATRATPLIHYAGIAAHIACVCEVSTSARIGQRIPGTMIPVTDEEKLIADQPPHALLLSWHIAASVVPALRARGYKGRIIIPLPEPKVISA
jgi:2-polyprenyl-3-methyl-5-hydroxy-6-metoxy-1,4-benzoquinol methylase